MIDDRPQFTFTLTMAECFALKDALVACNFLAEENWEACAIFTAAQRYTDEIAVRDTLTERIDATIRPVVRAEAQRMRELAKRMQAEYDAEVAEDVKQQIAEDTCEEHGVFGCAACFR